MAGKMLVCGFVPAIAALAVSACERAGVDYENRTGGTVSVKYVLKPDFVPQGYQSDAEPVVLGPEKTMLSVWRVGEHRLIEVKTSSGKLFRLEGAALDRLARRCPKQCILRITEDGVAPFQADFVGETAL